MPGKVLFKFKLCVSGMLPLMIVPAPALNAAAKDDTWEAYEADYAVVRVRRRGMSAKRAPCVNLIRRVACLEHGNRSRLAANNPTTSSSSLCLTGSGYFILLQERERACDRSSRARRGIHARGLDLSAPTMVGTRRGSELSGSDCASSRTAYIASTSAT